MPDISDSPDEGASARLRALLVEPPGPQVAAALADVDLTGLDLDGQLAAVELADRLARWAEAVRHEAIAVVAATGVPADPRLADLEAVSLGSLLAVRLRLTPGQATRRVTVATALAGQFADTAVRVGTGEIGLRYAEVLIDATDHLDPELAAHVQARVLPRAPRQTLGQFRAAVERAVLAVDPRSADERHRAARRDRHLRVESETRDGMRWLSLYGPTADIAAVFQAATADADAARRAGATDPLDGLRLDAVAAWAWARLAEPGAPKRHGRTPTVQVHVGLPTLLGLADDPGHVTGFGLVTAEFARTLAADGAWRRFLTDDTGRLADLGRTRYRPNQALRDWLLANYETCCFPGCRQPAWRADLDHRDPYATGGSTDPDNAQPGCRFHHNLKTHGGWRVHTEDGRVIWTDPLGRQWTDDSTDTDRAPPLAG